MQREPLRERMRGRWHGILPALGIPSTFLTGKHQPCPACGGKDRARFDDKEGSGSWICSQCGAGDGITLVMKVNGWDFKRAAEQIEEVGGDVRPQSAKPQADPEKQIRAIKRAWCDAGPIGPVVTKYLLSRGIDPGDLSDLRESSRHEMLALVRGADGRGCQVHRTVLSADGRKETRLFMPGAIPDGACVRLMPHDGRLGIAEGIETALSASILFDVPCWAALNTSLLKKWQPSADVRKVVVFADNDANFAGHSAAYELARKIAADDRLSIEVDVRIPASVGDDWNDVLLSKMRSNAAHETEAA